MTTTTFDAACCPICRRAFSSSDSGDCVPTSCLLCGHSVCARCVLGDELGIKCPNCDAVLGESFKHGSLQPNQSLIKFIRQLREAGHVVDGVAVKPQLSGQASDGVADLGAAGSPSAGAIAAGTGGDDPPPAAAAAGSSTEAAAAMVLAMQADDDDSAAAAAELSTGVETAEAVDEELVAHCLSNLRGPCVHPSPGAQTPSTCRCSEQFAELKHQNNQNNNDESQNAIDAEQLARLMAQNLSTWKRKQLSFRRPQLARWVSEAMSYKASGQAKKGLVGSQLRYLLPGLPEGHACQVRICEGTFLGILELSYMQLRDIKLKREKYLAQPEELTEEAKLAKKRRKTEVVQASRRRRLTKDQIGYLGGNPTAKCPVVLYVPATGQFARRSRQLLDWCREHEQYPSSPLEYFENAYHKAKELRNMPPRHMYKKMHFADKNLFPGGTKCVKTLTHSDTSGKPLKDHVDYTGALKLFASENIDLIRFIPEFLKVVLESNNMTDESRKRWRQAIESELEKGSTPEEAVVTLLSSLDEMGLEDPYALSNRIAALHDQDPDQKGISGHTGHQDKCGDLVTFQQLSSCSYSMVALQDDHIEEPREEAEFEDSSGYRSYIKWKQSLDAKDLEKVEAFEKKFLEEASSVKDPCKLLRVQVYHLEEGDRLLLAARQYHHATIIPYKEGKRRALMVYYEGLRHS